VPSDGAGTVRALTQMRIVAVDDNANMRRLIKDILFAVGIRDLRLAEDGPSALHMIETLVPDLILCDWHMAPMDGIAFLKCLRHRDNTASHHVPVIMLTAHTSPDIVRAAMEAGANHFVAKPLVPANLLKRMEWVRTDKRKFVLDGDRYVLPHKAMPTPAHTFEPEHGKDTWTLI